MNNKEKKGIDVHSHWIPAAYIDYIKEGKLGDLASYSKTEKGDILQFPVPGNDKKAWIPITQELTNFNKRYRDMEEMGIEKCVIAPIPFAMHYHGEAELVLGVDKLLNDSTAEMVAKYPGHMKGLAHVPLQSVKLAIKELERAVYDLKLSGVHLGTNIRGKYLGEEEFWEFFEAAEALNAIVLTHPIDVAGYARMQSFYARNLVGNPLDTTLTAGSLIFSGIFDKFPNLKIILCHAGGMVPYLIGRWDHGYAVREECKKQKNTPSDYLCNFYYDIITHSKESLRFMVSQVGSDRVLLGTDYPFDMGLSDPLGKLNEADFDKKDFERIIRDNSAELFDF